MEFINQNVNLKSLNTFGIDASAKLLATITDAKQLKALADSEYWALTKIILGGGSNVLILKDLESLVIHMVNKGIKVINEDDENVYIAVQAGESWHDFVLYCVENGYGGVENLSLIPGSVGASPMQNIGAYGVEIKEVFEELTAFNISKKEFETFNNQDCEFGYRSSVFKTKHKNKYIISSVVYRLKKSPQLNLTYGAIQETLEAMQIEKPTIKDVSDAVIKIRQAKLPDPLILGNSGSFFKNPVVPISKFEELKKDYPDMPHYGVSDELEKIPAGWLIEKAGFKGIVNGNTGTYKNQALIIVNHGNASGLEILNFSKEIQKEVARLFGIAIEAEVNLIP